MMRRHPRGQAVTELALGTLVVVPILLSSIYLSESAAFKLEATEAANEPLWDATAYSQQSYTGAFVRTPAAIGAAVARANQRMRGRTLVFTQASSSVQCGGAGDMGYSVGGTTGAYSENGGISCNSHTLVGAHGLTRFFLDNGSSGFFKEPMANWRRNFDFCANKRCLPFKMAIGDWGMTLQGSEPEECHLTMDGCANGGFFAKAKITYEEKQDSNGTTGNSHKAFMNALMENDPPADYDRVTDFQMSFRGEESGFMEDVPVVEGDREWRTTPFFYKRKDSYDMRSDGFLGL